MYNISFQYVQGSISFASLVKTAGTYGKSAMGQESSTPTSSSPTSHNPLEIRKWISTVLTRPKIRRHPTSYFEKHLGGIPSH